MSAERLLLCTDLDRTLLPNGAQPESTSARQWFARLVADQGVVLVYVTGRDRRLVEKAITNYAIPEPDFVISDVGTRIHDLRPGDWRDVSDWQQAIDRDWAGCSHTDLVAMFRDLPALRLQEHVKQGRNKLSYYVPAQSDRNTLGAELEGRLRARGVAAELVWSIDEPNGVGLLDIVPAGAGKLAAIEFLRQRLDFAANEVLFAGGSGNDLSVMTSGLPAVLVANASTEVRQQAVELARQRGHASRLYLAGGGFLGLNGNYAGGILEGVAHFHPHMTERLSNGIQHVS